MTNTGPLRKLGFCLAGIAAFMLFASAAQAVDWNAVKAKRIKLFYTGQASWEWALTQYDHSGAKKFKGGKNCIECHRGEEEAIGTLIVLGEKLEPTPIDGKRGSITLKVKMAHDGERMYVRLQWDDAGPLGGPKMDPDYAVKVTMMLDDGAVVEAKRAGCWGSCHDDAVGMASAPKDTEITKYLARSRTKVTREGGGELYKPRAELDALLEDGVFLEYWQARLNEDAAPVAVDGYILDKRHKNEAPAASAEAEFDDGRWVVVLSRELEPGDPLHKDIVPGTTYTAGFALHEGHAAHRFHHVSFEHTLVLDAGEADFVVTRQ